MDRRTVITAVEVALCESLGRAVPELTEETRLFEDLHLDSTTSLELLMAMEETFELFIDPETLDMDDFRTVGTFTSYVLRELRSESLQGEAL
ncbi:phosphopantetheine-binding protein [Streptomyces sp. NPDC002763]|uniref:acyl carrier protein n=1 Tax=Streptomyces sp. NPDC002763 TaxID=3154427 RepID=UPI003332B60E